MPTNFEQSTEKQADLRPVDIDGLLQEEKELNNELRLIDDYFTRFNRIARRDELDERIRHNFDDVKKGLREMSQRGAEILARQADIYVRIFQDKLNREQERERSG